MSYELKISPKERASGRFIGMVRKALISAAIEEKRQSGLSQQKVADCLGVNRSVINRALRGKANLTLRSIAEIAWAMGWEPRFEMVRRAKGERANHSEVEAPFQSSPLPHLKSVAPVLVTYREVAPGASASTKNYYTMASE